VTEPGFSVSVEDEDSEPSEPVEVTEESLDAIQEELEASEEAPEEEAAAEETPAEETQEEEATTTEETSSEESTTEETPAEETAPESTDTETEVASDDAGDSTDIEVDESLLDSSGVSDTSSDVEPEDLGTADDYEVAIELETVEADDANEDPTGEVAEEVAETTQETTVEVAPIFQVNAGESIESIDENAIKETLIPLAFVNPGELAYTITISGDDAELVAFDAETSSINLISALDYETQTQLSFTVTIESENADVSEIEVLLDVSNIDEPIELTSTLVADSFAESLDLQSVILENTALDPEGETISYTLSGEGSENFSVDANGNIILQTALDYETATSYALTLTASDGVNETVYEINFSITDVDEAPSLSSSLAASSFAENVATGTTIATASATDPEAQDITYSLSGTGSDNFAVSSDGTITTAASLDYETTTSYALTLTASDGTNSTSNTINISVADVDVVEISVADVVELSIALASSSISLSETATSGTSVTTTTTTTDGSATVSYSLSGTGSDSFAVSSDGTITTAASLDYETTTSFSLTLTATDGTNTVTESLTINLTDVDLALSSSLASSSQNENISTGTSIATSSSSNAEGTVSYSLTDADNKFTINSSTGAVTLANALDYETKTSHQFTITATDGVTTTSETFTLTVGDVTEAISSLSVTLANSGAAISEDSSLGTAVASSSLNNPNSNSITYSLSGTDNSDFAVDSSGNVTLATPLNIWDRKTYSLTLTAVGGGTTITDTFTVNVGNVEGSNSNEVILMRYSQAYNSASRTGFSATATRGPSGSTMPAIIMEQVGNPGAGTSSDPYGLNDLDVNNQYWFDRSTGDSYIGTITNGGNQMNWQYVFPFCFESGACASLSSDIAEGIFAPNETLSGIADASLKSTLGNVVTAYTSKVISAAENRIGAYSFWYMLTDQDAQNISYTSKNNGKMWYTSEGGTNSNYANWGTENGNLSTPLLTDLFVPASGGDDFSDIDFSRYALVVYPVIKNNYCSGTECQYLTSNYTHFQKYLTTPDSLLVLHGESQSWDDQNDAIVVFLESIMSGSDFSWQNGGSPEVFDTSVLGESIANTYVNIPANAASTLICDSDFDDYCYTTFAIFPASMTDSQYVGDVIVWMDADHMSSSTADTDILELAASRSQTAVTSTYYLYEDQAVVAGRVYEYQEDFVDGLCNTASGGFSGGSNNAGCSGSNNMDWIIAFAPLAIENHLTNSGTANDYFYPNFIPINFWSYGDVGLNYCMGFNHSASDCEDDYSLHYKWNSYVRDNQNYHVISDAKIGTYANNTFPEGMSMWWQMFRSTAQSYTAGTNGENRLVGPGLWAQISFKDGYDGASGSTTRDDQESLLNVVISQIKDRQYNTTKYSSGDTGLYMDGYSYWSYQGATNADNNGLGINYGTAPIECVSHAEGGCFFGDDNNFPNALMITTSDPYKSGDMTLAVNYNSNADTFSTGTLNQALFRQHVKVGTSQWEDAAKLTGFGCTYCTGDGVANGYFAGILEWDVSGTGNNQLAPIRSSSTLATFTFDRTNHDVQVVAPMTISAAPSNNYTSNWTTVDTGSITLKFGDASNDEAKSAFITRDAFAAEIQDDGSQIDGSSGGSNNLAGVLVSYNTIEKGDSDLFHTGGNDSMPDTAYSTWGFWAMSAVDISPNAGSQNASVHMGTWVAGTSPSTSDIPTSGTASMSGAAVMKVASRYNQTGTNYDVHKYTTTADVAATFNWGASGYSGSLAFTNFDDKNPIVANAGFASFTIAIAGTSGNSLTYSGDSTDSLDNSWLGGASAVGTLYGAGGIDESGGRVNVSLYKSGSTGTAGANDFYFAEGIYLVD